MSDIKLLTKHNDMNPSLVKLLSQSMSCLLCAIVGIVDNDLPATSIEEIPDQLLTSR